MELNDLIWQYSVHKTAQTMPHISLRSCQTPSERTNAHVRLVRCVCRGHLSYWGKRSAMFH